MQYRLIHTPNGERLWLPFLAGAAIISAPLWLNNKWETHNKIIAKL